MKAVLKGSFEALYSSFERLDTFLEGDNSKRMFAPTFNFKMAKTFILNDETKVNNHGFILLNAGINLDRFKDNPVMLFDHDPKIVIGKWENLRIEGAQLLGDAIFDGEDDQAKKIEGKVDRGFLKGASLGINPESAELRDIAGKLMMPVVTESELLEGSVVGIPSNALSLKLYSSTGNELSGNEIKLSIDTLINKTKNEETIMDKILLSAEAAVILGLTTEPESKALNAAIMELSARAIKAETQIKTMVESQANSLVDGAIKEGRISADKKESFVKLAISDLKMAQDMLAAMPPKETFSDKTKLAATGKGREEWDYIKWSKEDPKGLTKMSIDDPDGFKKLKEEYKPKH